MPTFWDSLAFTSFDKEVTQYDFFIVSDIIIYYKDRYKKQKSRRAFRSIEFWGGLELSIVSVNKDEEK